MSFNIVNYFENVVLNRVYEEGSAAPLIKILLILVMVGIVIGMIVARILTKKEWELFFTNFEFGGDTSIDVKRIKKEFEHNEGPFYNSVEMEDERRELRYRLQCDDEELSQNKVEILATDSNNQNQDQDNQNQESENKSENKGDRRRKFRPYERCDSCGKVLRMPKQLQMQGIMHSSNDNDNNNNSDKSDNSDSNIIEIEGGFPVEECDPVYYIINTNDTTNDSNDDVNDENENGGEQNDDSGIHKLVTVPSTNESNEDNTTINNNNNVYVDVYDLDKWEEECLDTPEKQHLIICQKCYEDGFMQGCVENLATCLGEIEEHIKEEVRVGRKLYSGRTKEDRERRKQLKDIWKWIKKGMNGEM